MISNHLISASLLLLLTAIGYATWSKMLPRDPYGLFHLTLNKQDPNDGTPPATEWLNMGYWKHVKTFPDACTALAMKLCTSANLKKGATVLDVGHGTGESLLLLISSPDSTIPQPAHLVGITSLEVHHQRSVERVHKYQAAHPAETDTIVDLYHADAICGPHDTPHPLHPTSETTFDSILALDCAYHFKTRRLFLEQAFRKLAPEGTIALADICFSASALRSRRTRILTQSVLKLMPVENLISTEDYVAQLQDIGYEDVRLEDITADVFPGFVKFLKSRGWGWWVFGWVIDWYAGAGAKFVIVSGRKRGR